MDQYGKSIRSTVSDSQTSQQNFVSLVSLFCRKREQVLHAGRFENKTGNEADTVMNLLDILDLKGMVFTMDALHCKKTLDKILESQNHYLVKVKANQPNLLKALEQTLLEDEPVDYYREEAISRGRMEIR